jgi:tRNA(His) guanylyltransferase
VFQFINIMAKSRFEYVKLFEKDDSLLPNTWIIIRLDGRGFHGYHPLRLLLTVAYRFSRAHAFTKPNDINALNLMNHAAKSVMRELSSDIVLGYGDSDEYRSRTRPLQRDTDDNSFLLTRDCKLYSRREFKIVSAFVSLFTGYYMFHWKDHFPDTALKYPPSFDGRAVLYPDIKNVRDYFAWRQADCSSHPVLIN